MAKITKKQITKLELCRYLLGRDTFNTTKVKANAFMDNRKPKELSVYQNTLPKKDMFEIGNIHVKKNGIKALAIIHSDNIEKHEVNGKNLEIISFPFPHKLHCNIISYDRDQMKERNIAHLMAEDSRFELIQ